MGDSRAPVDVVGREAELAELGGLLAPGGGSLRVAVVTGGPGSGKSTLVDAVVARASSMGTRPLVARPRETEQSLAFDALADLLGELLGDDVAAVGSDLPAVQRAALRQALALELLEPGEVTDPRAVAAGLRTVLAGAARNGRLLW